MTPDKLNGWNEWSRYVLEALKRHEDGIASILDEIGKLRIDISLVKQEVQPKRLADIENAISLLNREVPANTIADICLKLDGLKRELAFRAGIWGALAAAIPVTIALVINLVR